MSSRRIRAFSWPKYCLAGVVAVVAAGPLTADPPKEPVKPAARPANTTDLLKQTLEKLRKDLGPDDPAVKQLEDALKAVAAPKPDAAVPVPPVINFPDNPLRGDGDDFFDMAEELQQQMEVLRQAIQGRGGLQLQGGGFGGPFILGPGGLQVGANPGDARKGRFGVRIEAPGEALAAQLDLPNGQGMVCADVPADSVAGKAGIKPHDILLEVAGKPVSSNPAEFINQLKDVKADQPVDVVLLRKGRKETIKGMKLPEAQPAMNLPALRPQPFPQLQLQPFQQLQLPLPINPPPAFPAPLAGVGENIQVQQQDSAFTVQMTKDGVKLTLTGNKEDGKPVVGSIEVESGGKVTRAESIDKLPKEFQGMAEKAVKSVR